MRSASLWPPFCVHARPRDVDASAAVGGFPQPHPGVPRRTFRCDVVGYGFVRQVSPQAWTLVQDIANRVSEHSGAALLMDYGREGPLGDSLQAIRRHEFVDLLDDPGGADLSAHVDFGALREAVNSGPGDPAPARWRGELGAGVDGRESRRDARLPCFAA